MRILMAVFIVLFTLSAFSQDKKVSCEKPLFVFNYSKERVNILKTKDEDFRRGCCSHHGGVCGCSSGRALCCDGTLSPTCGCD
jgi:hypothetical protein